MARVCHSIITIPQMYNFVLDILVPSINKYYLDLKHDYKLNIVTQGLTEYQVNKLYLTIECPCNIINVPFIALAERKEALSIRQKIRQLSFIPDYDYYIVTDDDFEFGDNSFSQYRKCCDYLESNKDCCVVTCSGYLGGYRNLEVAPTKYLAWMNKGLVFRNLERDLPDKFNVITDKRVLDWSTCFDDWNLCYLPMDYGYHTAKLFNVDTKHYHLSAHIPDDKFETSIPKKIQPYLKWKTQRNPSTYTVDDWKLTEEYKFYKNVFGLPDTFSFTYKNFSKLKLSKDFISQYRQTSKLRFNKSRL